MSNEFSGNLSDFHRGLGNLDPLFEKERAQMLARPSLEEINVAIDTLNRFYEVAPFGHGEIEHTVNALDEYRHRINQ